MAWSLPQSRAAELMDDPALDAGEHLHALSALARINAVSLTAGRLADRVGDLVASADVEPVEVVDLACGGGDVTIDLACRLRRAAGSRRLRVTGVDASDRAIARARGLATRRGSEVAFAVRDVLADGCPPCDVVVSSLFLHHLDDATSCDLLGSMAAAARVGIVVSDLVRSRFGLALAVVGTTLLSGSRVARVDGPLSVRAARTPTEYRALCDAAGLGTATIRRVWPERVLVCWRRPAEASR